MDSHLEESYSIADARQNLAALVHRAEQGGPIGLTRRGKRVAVILSQEEYSRLRPRNWWKQILAWRRAHPPDEDLAPAEVDSWRQRSPGRDVSL